jgi:hypothetical protein
LLFLWPGLVEFVTTGKVHMHWSRLIVGAFTVFSAAQTAVFALLMKVISIWQRERENGRQTDGDSSALSIHSVSTADDRRSIAA